MFKLTSLNLNGIRSATTKGVHAWIEATAPDCICVQEIKAQAPDMAGRFEVLAGMKGYFQFAEKKGYSGVGVYTRHEPSDVIVGFDAEEFDAEGRYVEVRFDTPSRKFSIISSYFPSGSSGEERQGFKFQAMDWLKPILDQWLASGRDYVLCGDWNIVRSERDIRNWKSNQKNSGCLPPERAWLNGLIADEYGDGSPQPKQGWKDAFRVAKPDAVEYSWWSARGGARANNVGWRIDYQIATPKIAERISGAEIFPEPRFSDHAPYAVEYA